MRRVIGRSVVLIIAVFVLCSISTSISAAGYYVHDPMDNPKAAADIVVDPDAVYGYAPNPDSARLGVFAGYDWSDEAFVAQMRQDREDYHQSMQELYQIKADMEAEGRSVEEIARAVSTRRNEIRMEAYKDDPQGLEDLKQSNLAAFGNENGGTPDYFYQKYGSWETVIEKAFSTNAGADAVLGLYDKYYDTYFIDSAEDSTEPVESTEGGTTEETGEPASEDPADSFDEPAETSPKTGDPVTVIMLIVTAAASAAAICIAKLKTDKQVQSC